MRTSARGWEVVGLLAAALSVGCPKKPPPEEEPLPATVELELQLVSVSPGVISPEEPTSLVVYGAGFQRGIKGWLGETSALRVNWRSENQVELVMPAMR